MKLFRASPMRKWLTAIILLLACCIMAILLSLGAPPNVLYGNLITKDEQGSISICDDACCASVGDGLPHHAVVPIRIPGMNNRARMAVHAFGDIVSNSIRRSGGWEFRRANEILRNLAQNNNGNGKGVLLDIGANIGWFSLVAAYSGYNVVAVEPFEENRQLFKRSLCLASEEIRKRVTIVPYSLGPDSLTCELWQSPSVNRGDTITTCSGTLAHMKSRKGWVKLGETQVRTLDSLLPSIPTLQNTEIVMKIDTEGFEAVAMMGMRKFYALHAPSVIFTEFSRKMIERAGKSLGYSAEKAGELADWYREHLNSLGYKIVREDGKRGPIQDIYLEKVV